MFNTKIVQHYFGFEDHLYKCNSFKSIWSLTGFISTSSWKNYSYIFFPTNSFDSKAFLNLNGLLLNLSFLSFYYFQLSLFIFLMQVCHILNPNGLLLNFDFSTLQTQKTASQSYFKTEMEKRADAADTSVLFFSLAVLIFWLYVYAYTHKLDKKTVLLALC